MEGAKKVSDAERLLKIYLNDHLAVSVGTRSLAGRCLSNNPGGPVGDYLRRFIGEIDEEQSVLRQALSRLGGLEDPVKTAGAWFLEKAGRLKFNGRLLGYSDLSRLEELEALVLGTRGKMALWSVLVEQGKGEPRLAEFDFGTLLEQARRQCNEAEELRREAARRAFGG